jgi:predicted RNA-binding Zn-ribbon protein involved in translation (DUF1610 family)
MVDTFSVADAPKPKAKRVRIPVVCNECGRKFSLSPNAVDPHCSKCGGVDIDLRDHSGSIG